jgi:hypothetical protein
MDDGRAAARGVLDLDLVAAFGDNNVSVLLAFLLNLCEFGACLTSFCCATSMIGDKRVSETV